MPRIPQILRKRTIGMLDAGMKMNAVSMNIGCSTPAIRHLKQRFQVQGIWKIDHVLDVRSSRRVAKTSIFGIPTCAIASKPPQLLLLTHSTINHGTHNNRMPAQTVRNRLREGGLSARVGCVLAQRHHLNRVSWARTHQCWLRQQYNSVLFFDESRVTIHRGDGRVLVYCVTHLFLVKNLFLQ